MLADVVVVFSFIHAGLPIGANGHSKHSFLCGHSQGGVGLV